MPTYAIGDIQGCFRTLERLLRQIAFQPDRDRLWLVGDLVNRGPRSLDTLRFARSHEPSVVLVLGNHDLHFLARAVGVTPSRRTDTLDEILKAPDCDALVEWLRTQPLVHSEGDYLMMHAGLLPAWTEAQVIDRAREAELALRSGSFDSILYAMRNRSAVWDGRPGQRAQQVLETIRIITRIRTVDANGEPNFDFAGTPQDAPTGHRPWFDVEHPRRSELKVVFGHWAALGRYIRGGVFALDSGCVWGRTLTALRVDDGTIFEEAFAD